MKISNELKDYIHREISNKRYDKLNSLKSKCNKDIKEYNLAVQKFNKEVLRLQNNVKDKGLCWSIYTITPIKEDNYNGFSIKNEDYNIYNDIIIKLQYADSIDLTEIQKMIIEAFK